MSRSFKHTPVYKAMAKDSKDAKRRANKRLRRLAKENTEETVAGKSNHHRKENETWNICDYRFWGEPIWREESWRNIADDKNHWEKVYKRK